MVVVLIHPEVILALRCANGVLGDSGQDNVHKLDIVGAHEEVEQSAVHATTVRVQAVDLTKELREVAPDLVHEDRLLDTYNAHDDARSNAAKVVCQEPGIDRVRVFVIRHQFLVADTMALDGRREQDEVREAQVGHPSDNVGSNVARVPPNKVFTDLSGHTRASVHTVGVCDTGDGHDEVDRDKGDGEHSTLIIVKASCSNRFRDARKRQIVGTRSESHRYRKIKLHAAIMRVEGVAHREHDIEAQQ